MPIIDNLPQLKTLIFDLDGTLVDSAPTILSCLEATVVNAGHSLIVPLDSRLIGPPLHDTLVKLTGLMSPDIIQSLVDDFKLRYDDEAPRITRAFPGIQELLETLHKRGAHLHLATNKRLVPTLRILNAQGWSALFISVFAQDKIEVGYPSKAEMIKHLLQEQAIDISAAAYVGDTRDDGLAASENGLLFIAALWGYDGELDSWSHTRQLRRFTEPLEFLDSLKQTPAT